MSTILGVSTRSKVKTSPSTVRNDRVDGRDQWFIWNETTAGENFAEKWNRHPGRAEAFFTWHARFCSDLIKLETVAGIDRVGETLKDCSAGGQRAPRSIP
jgi:hypothetical protein